VLALQRREGEGVMGLERDQESELTLLINVKGVLYPIAMTKEQKAMIDTFVASVSKEESFRVLKKVPVAITDVIISKIEREYGLKVIQ
jgi:hypothetical protein